MRVMKTKALSGALSQEVRLGIILVPIDFSTASKKAVRYALRFAKRFGSEIILLHVLENNIFEMAHDNVSHRSLMEEKLTAAEKNLRALCASPNSRQRPSIISTIRTGHVPHEIAEAARELDVDLIVMAAHGYNSWKHLCLASTTEQVVRCAPCPVLAVREKEHDFC